MDAEAAADLQRDQEWEGSPDEAARAHVEAALRDTHTCLPGIVKSFNETTQTATVQPAIQRIFIPEGPVDLPQCMDVPVQFPRGGNFVMTFPVAANDECLLVFSERAIDFWWDRGGVQLPAEYRRHDLSDAFAIMGVSSRPKMVSGFATSACEIRTLDGSTVLRIENSQIFVGGVAGAEPPPKGTTYRAAEDAVFTSIVAAIVALGAGLTALGVHTHETAVTNLGTQMTTFNGAAASYLATKAKVL